MSNKDITEDALSRFKIASEAWSKQRKREVEDLRFQDPGQQWTDEARAERRGNATASPPIPPRPMLSISKLNQPYQLIRNQQRQARLGINLHPRSEGASPETAKVIQGIYRSIEQESRADQARGWAFARAAWAGFGVYRIDTDYADEEGRSFDQVIRIKRIQHQDSVYFDPSARLADFSDGNYLFECEWVPVEQFRARYPGKKVPDAGSQPLAFESAYKAAPEWVELGENGKPNAVLTASYWYKTYEKQTFVEIPMPDGGAEIVLEDEIPEGVEAPEDARRRTNLVPTVWTCILAPGGDADAPLQMLEKPSRWNGQYIPYVPVYGEELLPFDEQRRYVGLVYSNRDAQRFFNYSASSVAERIALEPKAPFVLDPEQIEGYEPWWQQANTRNFPWLPAKRYKGEKDYGVPQRAVVDASGTSLSIVALQQANDWLQSGTFAYDPSLGQGQPQRSGKAILAEQQQFELSSSGYLYNLADVSMNYEARIVLDLIPKIYDRPGRIARVLDEEDQTEMVMLNQPYVEHPRSGMPMPVGPEGPPIGMEAKQYDLRKGVYSVSITVGKSFQSLRQEGSQVIGEILTARPELMPLIGPLYFGMQDFPGATELKDLLVKVRAQQMPFLEEEGSPEQLQAQLMQAQQQMQMMGQQMQMMQQELQTKQIEQQGKLQIAGIDQQTSLAKAKIDQDTQLQIAAMKAQIDQLAQLMQAKHEEKKIQLQTEGKIAEKTVEAALAPVDLNFKQSAKEGLPKGDKRF